MTHSVDTACAAFDAGINFFFLSADLHWPYYESARRGLEKLLARGKTIREQIVIAVASYITQPGFCAASLSEILGAVSGLEFIFNSALLGGSSTT